ncbi:hypothetical protein ACQPW3_30950 [Actinosynnema sp. CA-248983]
MAGFGSAMIAVAVMAGSAERAVASWTANAPTPPVAPEISTVSPARGWTASTSLRAAVPARPSAAVPARPSAAARAWSRPSGMRAMPYSVLTTTYSAKPPWPRVGRMTTPNTSRVRRGVAGAARRSAVLTTAGSAWTRPG